MAYDNPRRQELMRKLQESEERSATLAIEIEEKRRKLAGMQDHMSSTIASGRPRPDMPYPKVVVPPPEPEPNLDDDPEFQAEMERGRKEAEDQADQLSKDFKDRCSVEATKLQSVSGDLRSSMDSRISDINKRYSTHADSAIRGRSTDVLRMNKIIRDLSRSLGAHWKPVFLEIMVDFPQDVVQAEINEIEKQRGFIQAYKALTIWKDMKADEVNMNVLINALNHSELYDLADNTLATLDAHGEDSLIAMSDFGTGIKSASSEREIPARPPADGDGAAGGEEAMAASAAASRDAKERLAGSAAEAEAHLGGPLGDRKLLVLARQIGNNWVALAKALEVPSSEIQEIYNSEGDTYQGAFKAIYYWKDSAGGNTPANVEKVKVALKQINRDDVVDEHFK